jgi:hypothetical protein
MSLPYVLNGIQRNHWTMKFDYYAKADQRAIPETAEDRFIQTAGAVGVTAVRTGIFGRIQSKPESSRPVPGIGRSNQDQMDTMDVLRVHIQEDFTDGSYVQNVTPGHPEEGSWYLIQGDAQILSVHKTKKYYVARVTKPPKVAE